MYIQYTCFPFLFYSTQLLCVDNLLYFDLFSRSFVNTTLELYNIRITAGFSMEIADPKN